MVTIGYGEITPKTSYEKVYVIIVTFISCGTFAYAINLIGEQIKEMGREKIFF